MDKSSLVYQEALLIYCAAHNCHPEDVEDNDPNFPTVFRLVSTLMGWQDAGLNVWRTWTRLRSASTAMEFASTMTEFNNEMSQLVTWLPGYDYRLGDIPEDGS